MHNRKQVLPFSEPVFCRSVKLEVGIRESPLHSLAIEDFPANFRKKRSPYKPSAKGIGNM